MKENDYIFILDYSDTNLPKRKSTPTANKDTALGIFIIVLFFLFIKPLLDI